MYFLSNFILLLVCSVFSVDWLRSADTLHARTRQHHSVLATTELSANCFERHRD